MRDTKLRNVAVIAYVDHDKITLVGEMLKQDDIYRENQTTVECVMDFNGLEREHGITVLAKDTAVYYRNVKINIVDTSGHADFGDEVERILKMINDVILLVDATEGPMPQTRFVLSKALELGHKVIVVVNKVDRPDQHIHEIMDEVLGLLLDLNTTGEQFKSPTLFCSGRQDTTSYSLNTPGTDLVSLFETIPNYIPTPEADAEAPFQMLVSSIDYGEFMGHTITGRTEQDTVKQNQEIAVCNFHRPDAALQRAKAIALYQFDDLGRVPVTEVTVGNIIAMSGVGEITISDAIYAPDAVRPIEFVRISTPTVEMTFLVNDSPFAGEEGRFVASRRIRERLSRETMKDMPLQVTGTDSTDAFNVTGRDEMSLSILIGTMRREGYEFQVSPPRMLYQEIDGKIYGPVERLMVDVSSDSVSAVIEKIGARKGDLLEITPVDDRVKLEFLVPSRGLFSYHNEFLTDTRDEGIIASVLDSYAPVRGEIQRRNSGSLVSLETGESITYGLYNAQERGMLFIGAGVPVYAGMVVGETPKQGDVSVNIYKKRQLANIRASGSDNILQLTPPHQISLEQCLEFLADDELLKVTPEPLYLCKRLLDHAARMREASKKKG